MNIKTKNNFDKKILRLISILNKLDNGGKIATKELAKDFNVTIRTIQRDINLLEKSGFPIAPTFERGIYEFVEGFSLKKIMLTNEEASIISLMCDISHTLGERFEKSFNCIWNKILASSKTSNYFVKVSDGIKLKEDFKYIDILEKAIEDSKKIGVVYEKVSDEEQKYYKLRPLKIIFFDGFWYLMAQTDYNKYLVKFRLDNIIELKIINEFFTPPENLKTMLEESINIFFSDIREIKAILEVEKEIAGYFKKKNIFPKQNILEEKKDGSLLIESLISQNMEIIGTIFQWMPFIKVIEPKELKKEITSVIEEYLKKNK